MRCDDFKENISGRKGSNSDDESEHAGDGTLRLGKLTSYGVLEGRAWTRERTSQNGSQQFVLGDGVDDVNPDLAPDPKSESEGQKSV